MEGRFEEIFPEVEISADVRSELMSALICGRMTGLICGKTWDGENEETGD